MAAKKVKNRAKKTVEQSTESLKKRIKELELEVAKLSAELIEARGKKNLFKRVATKRAELSLQKSHSLQVDYASSPGQVKPGPIPTPYGTRRSPQHTISQFELNLDEALSPQHSRKNTKTVRFKTDTKDNESSPLMQGIPMHNFHSPQVSLTLNNMVKVTTNDQEEWSGSDGEMDFDGDMDDEVIDELLKEDGGEEELNYIHEISELRRKLEDASRTNQKLNDQIASKNNELEQCNIKIQELVEEADTAKHEVIVVKRQLSNEPGHSGQTTHSSSMAVPDYRTDDETFHDSEDSMRRSSDTDDDDEKMSDIPPLPVGSMPSRRPQIVDEHSKSSDYSAPAPPLLTTTASTGSVVDGHDKEDSSFSFNQTNNQMLSYLMQLQANVDRAKGDMQRLTDTIERANTFSMQQVMQLQPSDSDERSDSSQDTATLSAKEEKLERALNRNLSTKSGF